MLNPEDDYNHGADTMSLDTLQDLLVAQLKDIYSAEKQLARALPRMARVSVHRSLADALRMHLDETRDQMVRLEAVLESLGSNARGRKCQGMEGLLEESSEVMAEEGAAAVIDAGLIANARRVEHYQIAAYTATIALAMALRQDELVHPLNQNLEEELAMDERLAWIASSEVNPEAVLLEFTGAPG
jgi:ferritin-like metal-binding protein YciE